MKLRPYQIEAVEATMKAFEDHPSVLIQLATGLGKTVIAAAIAKRRSADGRILLIAHRRELIAQGSKTFGKVLDTTPELEMADSWARERIWGTNVVVASIQTLARGRIKRFDPQTFSVAIIDEAHHSAADTYRRALAHLQQNSNLKVLGMTATADRHDGKGLRGIFDTVAYQYDIADAIDDAWLVPIEQHAITVHGLDYSQLHKKRGDFSTKDLGRILEFERTLHGMTTPVLDICGDETTLIFAATVAQARRMAEIMNRHKPHSAEVIDAKTPKDVRKGILEAYAAGRIQYLVNVAIATEGFDEPRIRYVVMGRPTLSRPFYAQMVGRGTRPLPGIVDCLATPELRRGVIADSPKPKLTVIDFAGNAGRHKLIHPADLLGDAFDDEVIALANEEIERKEKPADVASELVKAEREIERRRREKEEARLREQLKLRAYYTTNEIDPFAPMDVTVSQEMTWDHNDPPTVKQLEFMKRAGLIIPDNLSKRRARAIIGGYLKDKRSGGPSEKVEGILRDRGLWRDGMTKSEAHRLVGEIAEREGWRRTG